MSKYSNYVFDHVFFSISNSQVNSDIVLKKTLIEQKLEQSGKKAELENFLRERLIESGWKDKLQQKCLGK